MLLSNTKRNFLFGRVSDHRAIRPPWSIQDDLFVERCTRCGECIKECPNNVIRIADGGFPEMNFSAAGCDFCEVCVDVCESGALRKEVQPPFDLLAAIDQNCFSERGVICRSCGEVCHARAIRFQQVVGGVTHVMIDFDTCNGCGECVSICPAESITMKHRLTQETPA